MSLVEAILAMALFAIISTGVISAIVYGQESTKMSGARERAVKIAEEGLEAVRNIRDSGYSNLPADGTYGLAISGGIWTLTGSSDVTDIFTRTVTLSTVDSRTRNVVVNIAWSQALQRNETISLNEHYSNWTSVNVKGMLVYGDGGTTSDAIKYQIYDPAANTWSVAAATADVDTGTTNKYLRSARVYASATRNEKILVSRHYNGTAQFIYAQVYNGTSGTWGNVVQLSTWTATTYLDVQNYDGSYLANGDFMVAYSDNTTTPKFRIWNGSSWGAQTSAQAGSGIPTYIDLDARPGTSEAMMAIAGQNRRTMTQYYDGVGYTAADWTYLQHSTNGAIATVRLSNFDWSPNDPTRGALVYESGGSLVIAKIFTANGTGGGAWSAAVNGPAQTNSVYSVGVSGRNGGNEFVVCSKDSVSPKDLTCQEISSFTPTFVTPTNNILTAATQTGIQMSMDYEYLTSGNLGLAVYSTNAVTPNYRTYNPSTNTFSAQNTMATTGAILHTAKILPSPNNDDAMVMLGNANLDLYTVVWDGATSTFNTVIPARSMLAHGINGSATTDYWFDFIWDSF